MCVSEPSLSTLLRNPPKERKITCIFLPKLNGRIIIYLSYRILVPIANHLWTFWVCMRDNYIRNLFFWLQANLLASFHITVGCSLRSPTRKVWGDWKGPPWSNLLLNIHESARYYLKKFTFIYCQTVLNFTLDISDGLIINRFTQRAWRKSRVWLEQFTCH